MFLNAAFLAVATGTRAHLRLAQRMLQTPAVAAPRCAETA